MKPSDEEKKEFKPKEGERILVGLSNRAIGEERTFLYISKRGDYMCVHADDEDCYNRGHDHFRVASWPHAKPLPPKLPEFIDGDPVIVWVHDKGTEHIRIVDSATEDGRLMCYSNGRFSGSTTGYSHYKPFHNYDYGGRDVWGSEDKK